MDMTDGDSQRIGCVEWLGVRFQFEQCPDHLLNLRFFSPAVSGDGAFHLSG